MEMLPPNNLLYYRYYGYFTSKLAEEEQIVAGNTFDQILYKLEVSRKNNRAKILNILKSGGGDERVRMQLIESFASITAAQNRIVELFRMGAKTSERRPAGPTFETTPKAPYSMPAQPRPRY